MSEACEADLKDRGVTFERMDPIEDEDGCGAERPLKVTTLSGGVRMSEPATMRCEAALALDRWLTDTVQPTAKLWLNTSVTALAPGSHYDCRGRNGDPEAKLSEHAFANAIDIARFVFANGKTMTVEQGNMPAGREQLFQAGIRASACAWFTTVLGPGSDAAHKDHLHFDLAKRRNGYRLCQ